MISAAASEGTSAALVLVPAIIAVCGVLIVGVLQALVNRRIHIERLAREAAVERRKAFTQYMAIMTEKQSVETAYRQARDTLNRVNEHLSDPKYSTPDGRIAAGQVREKVDERLRAAVQRRDDWSIRRHAAQIEALTTLDAPNNPLGSVPDLMNKFGPDEPRSTQVVLDCMMALHIDGELNQRRRKKDQDELRALLKKRYGIGVKSTPEQVSASPSGAGHQGTDNEHTSETQGGSNGSRNDDEPGSPPRDRQ